MKKTLQNKIKQAIENLTWKNVSRMFYCALVTAVVYFGFKEPETIPVILEAITKALSFII